MMTGVSSWVKWSAVVVLLLAGYVAYSNIGPPPTSEWTHPQLYHCSCVYRTMVYFDTHLNLKANLVDVL